MKPDQLIRKLKETFAAKIFLVSILSIVILSMSLTGFFVHRVWRQQTENLEWQGEVLTRLLADTSRLGVFAENPELLKEPMANVLSNKEVLYVSIYGQEGALIREEKKGKDTAPNTAFRITDDEKRKIFSRLRRVGGFLPVSRNNGMADFWAPVLAGPDRTSDEDLFFSDGMIGSRERTIGFVRVVIDKALLNRALARLVVNSSLIALFFLLAAAIFVILVVKGITGPLNRLTERVRMMGSGAALEKVPVETGDEVGKLAVAFNAMTDSLQGRDQEKARLEQQLSQSLKMEALGKLAGGVAHDFNNILSVIESCALLLQARIKSKSSIRSYVDQISSATERASELTRRLLMFSRNQIINPKAINLNKVISDISKLLTRLIGENVDFRISLSEDDLVVMADELQIDQILINLVTNARDAMPDGGILSIATGLVSVSGDQDEEGGCLQPGVYARLSVSDTGGGIDPVTRERIFDPFFTTKEEGKGTGLGLSMAFGIVSHHRGHIRVESEPGKGCMFSVYLPLVESVLELKKDEDRLLPAGNRETILVAEDDRFVRMLTKHILTRYGYQVIDASDGEDALVKFREHADSVRLLLLDVIMPNRNGTDIVTEVRKIKPGVKIILFSGHTHDTLTRQGCLTGDIPLLSKPMKPGELLVAVRSVLDGRHAGATADGAMGPASGEPGGAGHE